jgi:uncharacterized protein (TIGR02118 family)
MLALCAYYEGTVVRDKDKFDSHVENVHLPLVTKYPRLQALRYLKGVPRDGEPPRFYLAFELYFKNEEDFKVALASEERNAARDDVDNFAPLFDGEIHHVMYEVTDIPVPR